MEQISDLSFVRLQSLATKTPRPVFAPRIAVQAAPTNG
jgi:hypothetical protein